LRFFIQPLFLKKKRFEVYLKKMINIKNKMKRDKFLFLILIFLKVGNSYMTNKYEAIY